MFISSSQRGYTRDGQQRAAGRFLILFAHNKYKWEDQNNHPHVADHGKTFDVIEGDGFTVQKTCQCRGSAPYAYGETDAVPSYYLKYCPVHGGEYKTAESVNLDTRKLYAHVCYVQMSQCGQFMMGFSRTLQVNKAYGDAHPPPNNLILSGTYGGDGLTCDYEDLTEASRRKLVEVPPDLAEKFWKGGGWNSAGAEAKDMLEWALKTFPKGRKAAARG